jgi:hypothetical protein
MTMMSRPRRSAILKTARNYLKSKKAEDRIKGVDMLGELESKAKTARRDLCEAMLDRASAKVRLAAADSLKKVDKDMAELAIEIGVEMDSSALTRVAALKENGEPLTPLVMEYTKLVAGGTIKKSTWTKSDIAEVISRGISTLDTSRQRRK